MSLAQFDWYRFLAEISDIPPDVIFQIVENGELYEIEGHKIVVGMVSPTFKLMFYTTEVGDKTAQMIKVEEITRSAFQIIIDVTGPYILTYTAASAAGTNWFNKELGT